MPSKPLRPCGKTGCPKLTPTRFCDEHAKAERKRYDSERIPSRQRGYNAAWRRIRLQVMNDEPLCRRCADAGRVTAASLVHHIDEDSTNNARGNLEPLCNPCHETEHGPRRYGNG